MPKKLNIDVYSGDTFTLPTITWKDSNAALIDLTSYTALMEVKLTAATTSAQASITESTGITLGGAAGTVIATLTPAMTALITDGAVYDLQVTSASSVTTTLVYGTVTWTQDVARP